MKALDLLQIYDTVSDFSSFLCVRWRARRSLQTNHKVTLLINFIFIY